jgi:hypothetical protein
MLAVIEVTGLARLSLHELSVGFITEAYKAGAHGEAIMEHSWHCNIRTTRGYVRQAGLVSGSPVGMVRR